MAGAGGTVCAGVDERIGRAKADKMGGGVRGAEGGPAPQRMEEGTALADTLAGTDDCLFYRGALMRDVTPPTGRVPDKIGATCQRDYACFLRQTCLLLQMGLGCGRAQILLDFYYKIVMVYIFCCIERIKKHIRAVAGKNLSINLVKGFIDREKKYRELWIWMIAATLNYQSVSGMVSWEKLRKSFLDAYRGELLQCMDYRPEQEKERIPVNDPQLLIEVIAGLMKNGMFGDCNCEQLARSIDRVWGMEYASSTICQKIRGTNSIYSACIDDFLDKINQIRRENMRNKNAKSRNNNFNSL